MKYFNCSPVILISMMFILLISISGCRTVTEYVPLASAPDTVEKPAPLDIDLAGTAWILPDPPEQTSKQFPGYRGIFFGRDGRLLLINQDKAAGNLWSVEGYRITLSLLEGLPELPVEGVFLVYSENDKQRIRLVPETSPSSKGITLDRVKVNVDIIENHWIPKRLKESELLMWPMNREIHLMLLPNSSGLGVLGYGGENRFHGNIQLGVESFVIGPLASNRKIGPVSDFENLYIQRLVETNRYVQVGDDLYLYSDTSPVGAFRVRLFD